MFMKMGAILEFMALAKVELLNWFLECTHIDDRHTPLYEEMSISCFSFLA